MTEHSDRPSPELFLQTLNGYQRTAVLKTTVYLDVFASIGKGKRMYKAAFYSIFDI